MKRALIVLILLGMSPLSLAMSPGEYVARAGDCAACHTAPGSNSLTGGRAFATPMGDVYATNITPDPEQGIGRYDMAAFDRAMREGVARDGHRLYPAMPYTAYSQLSERDMRALYDYLMHEVAPEATPNRPVSWLVAQRWTLAFWNMLFHHDVTPYVPDPQQSVQWNRGAYLVQGLGHCGSCHTPRGWMLQEKGMDERSSNYLRGAELDGWYAPSLRDGQLVARELISLLKTGTSAHAAVAGTMAEVVTHSTQYLSDEDLAAIATYLGSLAVTPESVSAPVTQSDTVRDQARYDYTHYCSACHGNEGAGEKRVVPALAGSRAVMQPNATSLIRVILEGARTPLTQYQSEYDMPGIGWALDDERVAALINFLRSQWGNRASQVTPAEVKASRHRLPPPLST